MINRPQMMFASTDLIISSLSRYSGTGLGTTILGNRISHVFNLLGPR